jgi:hypothetical protein
MMMLWQLSRFDCWWQRSFQGKQPQRCGLVDAFPHVFSHMILLLSCTNKEERVAGTCRPATERFTVMCVEEEGAEHEDPETLAEGEEHLDDGDGNDDADFQLLMVLMMMMMMKPFWPIKSLMMIPGSWMTKCCLTLRRTQRKIVMLEMNLRCLMQITEAQPTKELPAVTQAQGASQAMPKTSRVSSWKLVMICLGPGSHLFTHWNAPPWHSCTCLSPKNFPNKVLNQTFQQDLAAEAAVPSMLFSPPHCDFQEPASKFCERIKR